MQYEGLVSIRMLRAPSNIKEISKKWKQETRSHMPAVLSCSRSAQLLHLTLRIPGLQSLTLPHTLVSLDVSKPNAAVLGDSYWQVHVQKTKKRKAGRGEEMKEGKREGRESQGSKLSTFLNLGNLFKHPLADFPSAHRNRVGCMTVLKPTPSAGYETQRRAHSNHGSPQINREVEQWTKSGLFHHLTSMEGEQPSQRKGWSEWWVIHTPPYMQDEQSEAV